MVDGGTWLSVEDGGWKTGVNGRIIGGVAV